MSRISALNGPSALENVSLDPTIKENLNNMASNENQDSDHSASTSHLSGTYCTSKIPLQRTVAPPSSLPTTASWEANAPGNNNYIFDKEFILNILLL